MAPGFLQNASPPLPLPWLIALAAIYLLAGVTGHDPWKTEDVIHIAIAHDFVAQGRWLLPHIAGETWPHTAPLYHWVAAGLGKLLGGLLEFHNAARLATTLFGALFLFALSGAARAFLGQGAARIAPLLAIGTLGLLMPLHEAQPAVAGLACAALAYWGAGLVMQGQWRGAAMMGAGIGLAFLCHGLAGLVMAIAVLPAPIFRGDWRRLAVVLAIALPLIAAWPLLVAQRSPGLWTHWLQWWQNELAEATTARGLPGLKHFEQLLWAAWPVLPLALWSLWLHRRSLAALLIPLIGAMLGLVWYLSGSSRALSLLPALLPLCLVAAAGADRLRRGAANAFDWFGLMTFACAACLIWLGASAQGLGWPPTIAKNFAKLAPGHEAHYSVLAILFALAITAAWFASWRLPRAGWRASLHWAGGVTLMWALVAILWLSWLDHGKSYRTMALSLQASLPAGIDCIERVNIGTAEQATLYYFTDIRTVLPGRGRHCSWRLTDDDKDREIPAGWIQHWQGNRPLDRDKRWYLDQRAD